MVAAEGRLPAGGMGGGRGGHGGPAHRGHRPPAPGQRGDHVHWVRGREHEYERAHALQRGLEQLQRSPIRAEREREQRSRRDHPLPGRVRERDLQREHHPPTFGFQGLVAAQSELPARRLGGRCEGGGRSECGGSGPAAHRERGDYL